LKTIIKTLLSLFFITNVLYSENIKEKNYKIIKDGNKTIILLNTIYVYPNEDDEEKEQKHNKNKGK